MAGVASCSPASGFAVSDAVLGVSIRPDATPSERADVTLTIDATVQKATITSPKFEPRTFCLALFGSPTLNGVDLCSPALTDGTRIAATAAGERLHLVETFTRKRDIDLKLAAAPSPSCSQGMRFSISAPKRTVRAFQPLPQTLDHSTLVWAASPLGGPQTFSVDLAAQPSDIGQVSIQPRSDFPAALEPNPFIQLVFAVTVGWLIQMVLAGFSAWRLPSDRWSVVALRLTLFSVVVATISPLYRITQLYYFAFRVSQERWWSQTFGHSQYTLRRVLIDQPPLSAMYALTLTVFLGALCLLVRGAVIKWASARPFPRAAGASLRRALYAATASAASLSGLLLATWGGSWLESAHPFGFELPSFLVSLGLAAGLVRCVSPFMQSRVGLQTALVVVIAGTLLLPHDVVLTGVGTTPPSSEEAFFWALALSKALSAPVVALAMVMAGRSLLDGPSEARPGEAAFLLAALVVASGAAPANPFDVSAAVLVWYLAGRFFLETSQADQPIAATPSGAAAPELDLGSLPRDILSRRQPELFLIGGALGALAYSLKFLLVPHPVQMFATFSAVSLTLQAACSGALISLLLTRRFNSLRGRSGTGKALIIVAALAVICCASGATAITQTRQISYALNLVLSPAVAGLVVGAVLSSYGCRTRTRSRCRPGRSR